MEELHEAMRFMNESTPEITVLMDETTSALTEGEKVMQGLKNNPLLRGGIPDGTAKAENFSGYRGEER